MNKNNENKFIIIILPKYISHKVYKNKFHSILDEKFIEAKNMVKYLIKKRFRK